MNSSTSGARRGMRRLLLAGGASAVLVLGGLAAPVNAEPALAPDLDPNTSITNDGVLGPAPPYPTQVGSASDFTGTGPDQPFRIDPFGFPTAVALVTRNGNAHCSGWMVGPDTVVTAGHCVHTGGSGGDWFPVGSLRVHPGRDGNVQPFPSCTVNTLFSVTGWTEDGSDLFDYGAMVLNCTVGFQTGWFGFTTASAGRVRLCGYPSDLRLGDQWCGDGPVVALTAHLSFYDIDPPGDLSGSPVFHPNHPIGCGVCVVAIHLHGPHGAPPHSDFSHGIRITPPVFDNLITWRGF